MNDFPADIDQFVEQQMPLFIEILQTDNPSGEEEEMNRVVGKHLKKLGAHISTDKTGNLLGFFGKGDNAILLGGHLDSVMPCKNIQVGRKGDILYSKGRTNLSADDGAGIFEVLAALTYLKKNHMKHCPVDVLFTVGEEIGGVGVRQFDAGSLRAKEGLLLDRAATPGTVVESAPFKWNFMLECKGIAAHALEADKGINAFQVAAECIRRLPQGKISDDTIVNIGKIRGGHAVNMVPDRVVLEGEVRSFDEKAGEKMVHKIQQTADIVEKQFSEKDKRIPPLECTVEERRKGYVHERTLPIMNKIRQAHQKLNMKTHYQTAWGCSDAGDLTGKGITTINYSNAANAIHTTDEWVSLKDVKTIVSFLVTLLTLDEK